MKRKVVIVCRRTRLEELVERFNTIDQARFYVESLGNDFSVYETEDRAYRDGLLRVTQAIETLGERFMTLERRFLPNFLFSPDDLVVVVGPDGLVANVLKYLEVQQVIGLNPDPARIDGILLPFKIRDTLRIVRESLAGTRNFQEVTMAQAVLNDGQRLLAVNDFFIGVADQRSFRYQLKHKKVAENQSSSGIVVTAPLGGSAWLSSILNGARQIMAAFGQVPQITPQFRKWSDQRLIFSVREPFIDQTNGGALCFGRIEAKDQLVISSQTPENGVIFSDGMADDFMQFNSGSVATISVAPQRGRLVI